MIKGFKDKSGMQSETFRMVLTILFWRRYSSLMLHSRSFEPYYFFSPILLTNAIQIDTEPMINA
jgi:hypothetical protein